MRKRKLRTLLSSTSARYCGPLVVCGLVLSDAVGGPVLHDAAGLFFREVPWSRLEPVDLGGMYPRPDGPGDADEQQHHRTLRRQSVLRAEVLAASPCAMPRWCHSTLVAIASMWWAPLPSAALQSQPALMQQASFATCGQQSLRQRVFIYSSFGKR